MTLPLTGGGTSGPGGAAAFTPTDVSGLIAWYKADAISGVTVDGTAVSSFTDSSGNANHAVQATGAQQPTYKTAIQNGKPALLFPNGGVANLAIPNVLNGVLTAGEVFFVFTDSSAGGVSRPLKLGSAGSAAEIPFNDGNVYDDLGSTARKSTGAAGGALSAFAIYNVSTASGAWTNRINGTQLFTTATNTVGWTTTPVIGNASAGAFFGYVGELLIYNAVLSAGNRSSVQAYLKAKWGTP